MFKKIKEMWEKVDELINTGTYNKHHRYIAKGIVIFIVFGVMFFLFKQFKFLITLGVAIATFWMLGWSIENIKKIWNQTNMSREYDKPQHQQQNKERNKEKKGK